MIKENKLYEYAKIFDNYYGTSQETVNTLVSQGKTVILELDWQGAKQVKSKIPCYLIFLLPPSIDDLKKRLIDRNLDENEIIEKISKDCKVDKDKITIILAPTTSMVGNLQVVARVLEVALHKAHELKFPLNKIVDGIGSAPIPPIAKDTLTGMGRTNDSIIIAMEDPEDLVVIDSIKRLTGLNSEIIVAGPE